MSSETLKKEIADIGVEFFQPQDHFGVSVILSWQAIFTALMAGLAAWVQSTYGESATDSQIAMREWLQWALVASFAGFIIAPWLHILRYLGDVRQSNLRVAGIRATKINSALEKLRADLDDIDSVDKVAVDSLKGKIADLSEISGRITTSIEKNLPIFVRYKLVWNFAHVILTFLCMLIAYAGYQALDAAKETETLRATSSESVSFEFR